MKINKNYLYGIHPIKFALMINPWRIKKIHIDEQKWQKDNFKNLKTIISNKQINYQLVSNNFFKKNYPNWLHQGIVAEVSPLIFKDKTELKKLVETKEKITLVLVDGLEDPHNLGAILRSCDAFMIDGLIIHPFKCPPLNHTVAKVASGALETVAIFSVNNLSQLIDELKTLGVWVYGLDMQGKNLNTYFAKNKHSDKNLIIIGAEGKGLSTLTKNKCDELLAIAMLGKIESLNASVSFSIALYEFNKIELENIKSS